MGKGKLFEQGPPYIGLKEDDIFYSKHDSKDYLPEFNRRKNEIKNKLLEGIIKDMKTFGVDGDKPGVQDGKDTLTFHVGRGGNWITIGYFDNIMGVVTTHNITGHPEKIAAFNAASTTLEMLDKELKAPRIYPDRIEYPLPEEYKLIPADRVEKLFDEGIKNMAELVDLKINEAVNGDKEQRIVTDKGIIIIKDGLCVGTGFKERDILTATFPMAKLIDICSY